MRTSTYLFLIIYGLTGLLARTEASVPDSLRAKQTALEFLNSQTLKKSSTTDQLTTIYASSDTTPNPVYLFDNDAGGFVLVGQGRDEMRVAGYSAEGQLKTGSLSPAFRAIIRFYEEIDLSGNQALSTAKGSVAPMLEEEGIRWDQTTYYNQSCPYDADEGQYTYAGCVAVAMGQIMRYHKHPASGSGSHSYTHPDYGELSVDYSAATYNWSNMPGELTSPNPDVADLLYHCGVAVNTQYTSVFSLGSGGHTSMVAGAFSEYFQYPGARWAPEDNFATVEEYHGMLQNELDQGRPVFYVLRGEAGHTVVCDGYDGDYFHINFGWSGSENGYFLLSGVQSISIYDFGFLGDAVTGISPNPVACNEADSLALVALYQATDGANWTRSDNWLTARVKDWYGVDVIDGRVVHLLLHGNNLTGNIPPELGDLTELTNLNLGSNSLSGSIPQEMGDLRKLLRLTLGFNQLSGELPEGIGLNQGMISLDLAYNNFEGSLPEQVGQLTNLKYLQLQNNRFTGTIPPGIINMSGLQMLNLSTNGLSGELPEDIGNLTGLKEFLINENLFTGQFPASVANMTNLRAFDIANNRFEGPLPPAIGTFDFLSILKLNNNRFTSLPAEIGQLSNLSILSIYNNRLDSLPPEIGELINLKLLNLSRNHLKSLPPQIGNLNQLKTLQLDHNQLTQLPGEMGNMQELAVLTLNHNQLTELPYEICQLNDLYHLKINNNHIQRLSRSLSQLKSLVTLEADTNQIAGPLPELAHLDMNEFFLRENRLVFSDLFPAGLPDDTDYSDNYSFFYMDQQQVPLREVNWRLEPGDSLAIDIRQISRLSDTSNQYTWYENGSHHSTGPVLRLNETNFSDSAYFHCAITNPHYTRLELTTDSIFVFKQTKAGTPDNPLISGFIPSKKVADDTVVLRHPDGLRGEVYWEASLDSVTWEKLDEGMSQVPVSENIMDISGNALTIRPNQKAVYRYVVEEENCPPLYSDTIHVPRWSSQLLLDTVVNASAGELTVNAPGIELVIPQGLSDDDFRLTIEKINTPPASPDTVAMGQVFDVKLSCGNRFDRNILVKIFPEEMELIPENIHRYAGVWYDENQGAWRPYEEGNFSLEDTCFSFETDHLTKLSYWEQLTTGGFDYKFVKDRVTVYYKSSLVALSPLYDKHQTHQDYHAPAGDPEYETPWMVQDAAHYTDQVMTAFTEEGLEVPDQIAVYIDLIEGYGEVGLMAMLNGYLTISQNIENPELLRRVIAHEYMHYTQDYYISAHAGNLFWMEANGHTADRMVWDDQILPVSESEKYLLDGRDNPKASIFASLANSWDYWDKGIITQNLTGNMEFCYLAGCFIHYMRSYRNGTKLSPSGLLKETSLTGTWKEYLDGFITNNLQSNIGEEFHQYVRYLFGGNKENFSLISHQGDPFKFLHQAPAEFIDKTLINLPEESDSLPVQKEKLQVDLPHLSAKVEQLYNMTTNRSVCVNYKRNHTDTANIRVYLATWNADQEEMQLEDISQVDSSFFFIEAATEENVTSRQNQAYLLMVNKSKDEAITADYELEITPVADFSFTYVLTLDRMDNYMSAEIHNMSNGEKQALSLSFTYPVLTEEKVVTDSSVTVTVYGEGTNGAQITQTTHYNFLNGNFQTSQNYVSHTADYNFETNLSLSLKDIFFRPTDPDFVSQGGGTFISTTSTTQQARSKITGISFDYYYQDTSPGGNNEIDTYHYTGTEWPAEPEVRIQLQVK
ncbi:MAG: C10 family peptidase [Bacteroidales bacterium]|nr:C10 family peptidase [Bacteroidales bacterium]